MAIKTQRVCDFYLTYDEKNVKKRKVYRFHYHSFRLEKALKTVQILNILLIPYFY